MLRRVPQNEEAGFALLFVFLMAAAVAITFYIQLPVAAFENQRDREQVLLDRGQEYRRGIQLYFRKFKRYPAELKALENTNNIRFIRRLYKDPMTGSDEWRLIHISPAGVLTDSLVQKKEGEKEGEQKAQSTFITEGPSIGAPVESQSSASAPWMRRRTGVGGAPGGAGTGGSSEMTATGGGVQPGTESQPATPEGESGDQPGEAQDRSQMQSAGGFAPIGQQTGQAAGQPGTGYPQQTVTGQYPQNPAQTPQGQQIGSPFPFLPQPGGAQAPRGFQPGVPGQPSATQQVYPQTTGMPLQQLPGAPVPYSQPSQSQPSAPSSSPLPFIGGPPAPTSTSGQPVSGGQFMFGGQPVGGQATTGQSSGQNPAADLIRKLLTTPNPRGLAAAQQQSAGGQQIGGGIAGVASKLESDSIKMYNERQKYQEWEFVYDYRQDRMNGALAGVGGTQGGVGQSGQRGTGVFGSGTGLGTGTGIQTGPLRPGGTGRRQ